MGVKQIIHVSILAATAAVAAWPAATWADSIVWQGGNGGSWSSTGNWSPADVPDADDVAVLRTRYFAFSSDSYHHIELDINDTVGGLTVDDNGRNLRVDLDLNGRTLAVSGRHQVGGSPSSSNAVQVVNGPGRLVVRDSDGRSSIGYTTDASSPDALSVINGASYELTADTYRLSVGQNGGHGRVYVGSGSSVSSGATIVLGDGSNSSGAMEVWGTLSAASKTLHVGNNGTGRLTVGYTASMNVDTLLVGDSDTAGVGVADLGGSNTTRRVIVSNRSGGNRGAAGTINLSGTLRATDLSYVSGPASGTSALNLEGGTFYADGGLIVRDGARLTLGTGYFFGSLNYAVLRTPTLDLATAGTFTMAARTRIQLDGGVLTPRTNGETRINGYLEGSGRVAGSLDYVAELRPGIFSSNPTAFRIDGDAVVQTLRLDLSSSGFYDSLSVGGQLDVSYVYLNGNTSGLVAGDELDLLDFDQLLREFTLYAPNLPAGLEWDRSDLFSDGILRVAAIAVVPTPGAMAGGLALMGLTATRRRRS